MGFLRRLQVTKEGGVLSGVDVLFQSLDLFLVQAVIILGKGHQCGCPRALERP